MPRPSWAGGARCLTGPRHLEQVAQRRDLGHCAGRCRFRSGATDGLPERREPPARLRSQAPLSAPGLSRAWLGRAGRRNSPLPPALAPAEQTPRRHQDPPAHRHRTCQLPSAWTEAAAPGRDGTDDRRFPTANRFRPARPSRSEPIPSRGFEPSLARRFIRSMRLRSAPAAFSCVRLQASAASWHCLPRAVASSARIGWMTVSPECLRSSG